MKRKLILVVLSGLMMLAMGVPAVYAIDWGVGGGVAVVPDYIGSDDYEAAPLPYFTMDFENHMNVHVVGARVQSNLIPHPIFKGGVVGEYIRKRDDDNVDNNQVGDLDEVDGSFMLGPWLGIEYATQDWGTWSARGEMMWDVADGNDGLLSRIAAGWGTGFARTMRIGLEAFTGFGDGDFMSSYFGVDREDSIKSGLEEYNADDGIYEVGLNVNYSWNFAEWHGRWNLHLIGGISQLVGDADDDSPVVDEGSETQGMGGVMITFHF